MRAGLPRFGANYKGWFRAGQLGHFEKECGLAVVTGLAGVWRMAGAALDFSAHAGSRDVRSAFVFDGNVQRSLLARKPGPCIQEFQHEFRRWNDGQRRLFRNGCGLMEMSRTGTG
jgi:hypothetical protein